MNVLTWHVHSSYLYALAQVPHDWYLPVSAGRPGGYGGKKLDMPANVHDVPANAVRDIALDAIIFQSPKNYLEDQYEILSPAQRRLPRLYLEHNTPRPHAVDTRHVVDDPDVLLVHVTHYNALMWDNGRTPTVVIEHSVAVDPAVHYSGRLARGITVCNGMAKRPRISGLDLLLTARDEGVPVDIAGIDSEQVGGLGDIPYRQLPARVAEYRFLFSPMRYTSLPLAVIEAMVIGLPIIALATTELPTVVRDGVNGYCSCRLDVLLDHARRLLADPAEARRLGANARRTAGERFGMERFVRDWTGALGLATGRADGRASNPPG
jgi:glycosyltransferase involved in cell wall biosynthesis